MSNIVLGGVKYVFEATFDEDFRKAFIDDVEMEIRNSIEKQFNKLMQKQTNSFKVYHAYAFNKLRSLKKLILSAAFQRIYNWFFIFVSLSVGIVSLVYASDCWATSLSGGVVLGLGVVHGIMELLSKDDDDDSFRNFEVWYREQNFSKECSKELAHSYFALTALERTSEIDNLTPIFFPLPAKECGDFIDYLETSISLLEHFAKKGDSRVKAFLRKADTIKGRFMQVNVLEKETYFHRAEFNDFGAYEIVAIGQCIVLDVLAGKKEIPSLNANVNIDSYRTGIIQQLLVLQTLRKEGIDEDFYSALSQNS